MRALAALALLASLLWTCRFDPSGLRPRAREAGAGDRVADLLGVAERGPDADRGSPELAVPDRGPQEGKAPDSSGPALTPLATDDGRLWIVESGGLRLLTFRAKTASFTAETLVPAVGGEVRWIAYRILASGEELCAFKVKTASGHVLELWRSTGGPWQKLATDATGDPDKRDFQLAEEPLSGAALLVFGTGNAQPSYRRISGGVASVAAAIPITVSTGEALWVELAARPASNELTLLFADDQADLVAVRWSGTSWDAAGATVLETELKRNPKTQTVSNRVFDGAYESSGALLVAWGRDGASGMHWRRRPAGGAWSSTAKVDAPGSGTPHAVDLAAEPGGDRVAGGFFDLGDGTERLGLGTWDGTKWEGAKEYDSQTRDVNDTATGDTPGAVAWRGASKQAVVVYGDGDTGKIDHGSWTKGDWVIEKDEQVTGKGLTESVELKSLATSDALLLVVSDDTGKLHAATFNGTAWSVQPAPLSTLLPPAATTVPFALDLRR